MLTSNQFDGWCYNHKLPSYTRELIERVRNSPPGRSVEGSKGNVCGDYCSQKMGQTIQFESHRNELAHIIEHLEHGSDVLEYYDQPPAIELHYLSKSKRPVRTQHTPDFFVIREGKAGWEECKTEEDLVNLAINSPHRYSQNSDGSWSCPPGVEYAQKYGLYYCIFSSAAINHVRLRNYSWLEPYYDKKKAPRVVEEIKKALISLVKLNPGITFSEILLAGIGVSPDDINVLIASQELYIDLSAFPLAEPDLVKVFLNQEVAFAQETASQIRDLNTVKSKIIKLDVGESISWDGVAWEIINTGSDKISLQKADGKVINLLYTQINDLFIRGEIIGNSESRSHTNIRSNKIQEILNKASLKDIEEANRRYKIIQPYLQPNPPVRPNSTIRRWRDKYWEAEKVDGNGYIGLIPRNSDKGNCVPILGEQVKKFMNEYIEEHYENAKNRRITAIYRSFREACKAYSPPLQPPSEKTFRLEIKRRSGYQQNLVRQGSRVAKQNKPFYSTPNLPRHGDLPWESAHIDHTQIDDELVSSLISLATCNQSSAISVNKCLGRPWATFMIDSYTRRLLAIYLSYEPPSYRSCMMVIRICVKRWKLLPQTLVTDNGKEFHSIYFKQLLAYCKCTHKYRPSGEPRYGAPVERVFNTTNTQWLHELKGNTQIMRQARQVTKSVNPKNHATWTIGELYQALEYWAYEIYDKREHSTLGQSPREAFELGIALGGSREFRKIEYDDAFRILTFPSPPYGKTRVVQPGQGIKISQIYYWCDAFRDPEVERTSVDVKCDPFDAGVAYAFVQRRWHQCISDHYQYLQGRTEKEIMLISEDLRRRKSGYSKRILISDTELVAHLNSAFALEGELLIQHLQARENKIVLDLIENKNISNANKIMANSPYIISESNRQLEPEWENIDNKGNNSHTLRTNEIYGEF